MKYKATLRIEGVDFEVETPLPKGGEDDASILQPLLEGQLARLVIERFNSEIEYKLTK